jgi:putative GTP pyrophosphokinase
MKGKKIITQDELTSRIIRFYSRYGKEIEQIKDLLEIKLRQISLAYTIQNNLPPEAVQIKARVKSLDSFLRKLERLNWPQFYYPTEVVSDLIGARAICWFIDDCYGLLECINSSKHFKVKQDSIEDFVKDPKPSGYRSIHLLADVSYDSIKRVKQKVEFSSESITCEIQIRTKLQDAWGDITHEFHYKAKEMGIGNNDYEDLLADISHRLEVEDRTLIKFRKAYQKMADDKQKKGIREGFRDE